MLCYMTERVKTACSYCSDMGQGPLDRFAFSPSTPRKAWWPSSSAMSLAVRPELSCTYGSDRASNSSSAHLGLPSALPKRVKRWAASCSGVRPWLSAAFGLAWNASSWWQTSWRPHSAAVWRGVRRLSFRTGSGSALACSSSWTAVAWPTFAPRSRLVMLFLGVPLLMASCPRWSLSSNNCRTSALPRWAAHWRIVTDWSARAPCSSNSFTMCTFPAVQAHVRRVRPS
mmetsp:Transcript_71165/g.201666  ORF Transcript_71165/g.201666 Transcript_71165/m.201666 type:complete len:228 (-) Transcript_71165:1427-2110(-)